MKDVLTMLASGSLLAYLVLIFSAVPLLSRGIFALKKSRSQQRKEFLELWKDGDKSDDFWLELMIGHCFGRALPAALVRQVMRLPSAPAKLSDLSLSWSWLAYDTASARLHWREERRNRGRNSTIELRACLAVYVMFAMIGILFTWKMPANSTAFLCGIASLLIAAISLMWSTNLNIASDTLKQLAPLLFGLQSPAEQ